MGAGPAKVETVAVIHIADFELDKEARQLRWQGEEVRLQPKVFDLLCYLITNQNRVIDKNELLDNFWPGVIVTDASLQRAISFARSALRLGGLENCIRTYSKHGYRFVSLHQPELPLPSDSITSNALLNSAYAYVEQREWAKATEAFADADSQLTLSIQDLEQWALSAQCAGRLMDAIDPLERAAAGYSALDEPEATARAYILLARIQLEAQENAIGRGCLARAESLIRELPLCEQHGHLQWVLARYHCYTGDMSAAIVHAEAAMQIGEQLKDNDICTVAKLYYGIATQAQGKTQLGLEKQDEAAASVVAGDVSPLIGGIVYCGLIAGCCNTGDWPRAGQWTENFRRWCQRMRIDTFAGSCILHRAEVYAARGDINSAEKELDEGSDTLKRSAPWAIGDVYRVLGDIYLVRGKFSECEQAYRQSYEHGWDPYPGYALLQFYRGQIDAALRGLLRATETPHWIGGERRGQNLAFIVILAAQSGRLEQAQKVLTELEQNPSLWQLGSTKGFVFRARGEVMLAHGNFIAAIQEFRTALNQFKALGLPIEAALIRLRIAYLLKLTGDDAGADIEIDMARRFFKTIQADYYYQMCDELDREGVIKEG